MNGLITAILPCVIFGYVPLSGFVIFGMYVRIERCEAALRIHAADADRLQNLMDQRTEAHS